MMMENPRLEEEKIIKNRGSKADSEISNITNLATNTAFAAVKDKIPYVSNLVKKTDYNTKKCEIEKKIINPDHHQYTTTQEFDKLTSEGFATRPNQKNIARVDLIEEIVTQINGGITINVEVSVKCIM